MSATGVVSTSLDAQATTSEAHLLFGSTSGTLLYKVARGKRGLDTRGTFKLQEIQGAIVATVGETKWMLMREKYSMKSVSSAQEPTYTFSAVDDTDPEVFFCVIFKAGTAAAEISLLDQILEACTTFHVSEGKPQENAGPKSSNIQLPNVDPNMMKELMRKGAEDTSMMFRVAGGAAQQLMQQAVELHKKCAPAPAAQPVEISPAMKEKLSQTKVAAKAGATIAKGVASGVVAATDEVTTAIAQVVVTAKTDRDKRKMDANGGKQEKGNQPDIAVLGDLGKHMVKNVQAVRASMFQAAEIAWGAAKSATEEVFSYQYGNQAGEAARDAMEVVEGVTRATHSMHEASFQKVAVSAAKKTASAMAATKKTPDTEGQGGRPQPVYPWQQLQQTSMDSQNYKLA